MDRATILERAVARRLTAPVYLTPAEAAGGWRERLPGLSEALPPPYPVFSADERSVATVGYPVVRREQPLLEELEPFVDAEIELRSGTADPRTADSRAELVHELRRRLRWMLTNSLLTDYRRGLTAVLLLVLSDEVSAACAALPRRLARCEPSRRPPVRDLRHALVRVVGDALLRATDDATDELERLGGTEPMPPPLLSHLLTDRLPLQYRQPLGEGRELEETVGCPRFVPERSVPRLAAALDAPWVLDAIERTGGRVPGTVTAAAVLDPRLWERLVDLGRLAADDPEVRSAIDAGLRLKRLELLCTARTLLLPISSSGPGATAPTARGPIPISSDTRPLDFRRPGVVSTEVRRYGVIYDLTAFTARLELVRKGGHAEEERALRFMFAFHERLEAIRARHGLVFEKFLGDGAFYSSRRAVPAVVAVCRIQQAYRELCARGFPFDAGIRLAVNLARHHLLALPEGDGHARFEFFGHGIVELTRLVSGKSSREAEEIAELLIHRGFDPAEVERFLEPLRAGEPGTGDAVGAVRVDAGGGFVNEGIAASAVLVTALERELRPDPTVAVDDPAGRWLARPVEHAGESLWLGLRWVGTAPLKGLGPVEIAELSWWDEVPQGTPIRLRRPLLDELRRHARPGEEVEGVEVPPDLAVASVLRPGGGRTWLFGRWRPRSDALAEAVEVPIEAPDLEAGEPLELWLFRHRRDLVRLYEGLRRDGGGSVVRLERLRRGDGYVGCLLAAPHRDLG